MTVQTEPTGRAPFAWKFNLLTLVAATTAALAAATSASIGWPVWAMFMGWVGRISSRDGSHSANFQASPLLAVRLHGWRTVCRAPLVADNDGSGGNAGPSPAKGPAKAEAVPPIYWLTAPVEPRDWWRCQSSACTSA
ncbi:hypothetical protein BLJAPNOD_04351 [Ensifer sp. M14]|uniref:hypothetical protein n=1 Tax=Ensifer sp. M14 TaxID=2203782 RepID=UPI000E2BE5DD|nr:hypothetical protein [Ensifer sp. M14]RDL48892.1 hypothetical protein BLJAPNOD_04351 [Ensifer sp. M14]